jgi:hypothetical protein
MLFDYIPNAYRFSVLILLLLLIFIGKNKKVWIRNMIVASNLVLLIYCCYSFRFVYDFINGFFSQNKYEGYTFWYSRADISAPYGSFLYLSLISSALPFLFLFRKPRQSSALVLIELVLLWWGYVGVCLASWWRDYMPSSWSVYYSNSNLIFEVLNYVCLFMVSYSLLWLLKWLPSQHKKNV